MASFYTTQGTLQNSEVDHKRLGQGLVGGRPHLSVSQYVTDGTEVNGDLIYIAYFDMPVRVDPTQSSVVVSATLDGAAVTMDIGDDPAWTTPTPDIDRYADAIVVTSAGKVAFDSVVPETVGGQIYKTVQGGWLVATINASTALNASITLTFRVSYTLD